MWKNGLVAGIGLVLLAGWGTAGELRVEKDGSGNFGTIQEAIDAAVAGDVVIVGDGTWQGDGNRDITFRGKTITVRSKNGPEKCIIDCQGGMDYAEFHRGFVFQSEEPREAILEGFTITDGVHSTGAGILCSNGSNPTLRGNLIAGNHVPYDWDGGGGIACHSGAAPWIVGNIIRDNVCEPGGGGGGIHCYESGRVEIAGNVIVNNSSSYGGGIEIGYLGSALVENNLIAGNQAGSAGGVGFWGADGDLSLRNNTIACNQVETNGTGVLIGYPEDATVFNCIVWGNQSSGGTNEQIVVEHGSANIRYCCIQSWGAGGIGNIPDDPLFVDAAEGDFHLQEKSPCVNTGFNTAVGLGVTDLDGRPRIQGGTVDMGAYEFSRPRVIYVDDSATGANDGTSWADAYLYLQDALAMANSGDGIRVAQGRYRPDQSAYLDGLIEGDRKASFRLKSGITIRGGYAGFGAANPDDRDADHYGSYLCGNGAYHVVVASGTDRTAVLDGFTISGGDAWHTEDGYLAEGSYGGGLYCTEGSPTIRRCVFMENRALAYGGGMYSESGEPLIENCRFLDNSATDGGGLDVDYGGAVVKGCIFGGNRACSYNADGGTAGAIYCFKSQCRIEHCVVVGNGVDRWGSVAGIKAYDAEVRVAHCILWNNRDHDTGNWALQLDGTLTVEYSCVEGSLEGFEGKGNFDGDPLFANSGQWIEFHSQCDSICTGNEGHVWQHGDYHLQSQAGRWDAATRAWVQDAVTSPCIDAGDPQGPIGLEQFPNGGVVNMGAYGGTTEASKSWFGGDCTAVYAGDINGDCKVDLGDFAILARHWLGDGSGPR
jgi:hypothetical protein